MLCPVEQDVRVSDAERAAAIDRLREETTIGRLTLDEFEDRIGEVYAAKTRRDLDHTLRELPVPVTPPASRPERRPPVRDEEEVRRRYAARVRKEVSGFLTTNIVCTSIWAMAGQGYYWPGWVLMGTGLGLVGTVVHGRDKEREKLARARRHQHVKRRMREVEARYKSL